MSSPAKGVEVERAAAAGDGLPLRHVARPGAPGRVPGARSSARRAPTSASLADDLGRALGGGAHLDHLRRTRIGSFGEADMRPTRVRSGPARCCRRPRRCATSRPCGSATTWPRPSAPVSPLDRVPLGAAGDGPWAMLDERRRAAGRLRGDGHRPHPARRRHGRGLTGARLPSSRDADDARNARDASTRTRDRCHHRGLRRGAPRPPRACWATCATGPRPQACRP